MFKKIKRKQHDRNKMNQSSHFKKTNQQTKPRYYNTEHQQKLNNQEKQ